MGIRAASILVLAGSLLAGCSSPAAHPSVMDPDPSAKIPGMKVAVRQKDLGAARQLVLDLGNDDPAVRLYAINGLDRLTGQRLGYEYYASEEQRQAAIARWQQWLAQQEQSGGHPTTAEAGR